MDVFHWPSGHRVYLQPVVRGLESERAKVKQALAQSSAKTIAISISKEELEGLEAYDGEETFPSNFEEDIYMEKLSVFGQVSKPPPCFLEARDLAKSSDLKLEPLDLNNVDFTEAYVANVSTIEMMTQAWLEGRLRGRRFKASTPEEFVVEFDRMINGKEGYRKLEEARERHMAASLIELAQGPATTLALVELERVEGVRQGLAAYLPR